MGSSTIKGITVALGGDTTQLQKSFKDLDGKSRALQKELTLVNKELKFDPKNSTLLAAKQEVLSEKVETTRQKLKLLNDMQAEVEKQAKAGTLGADKYRQYQTEVESTKNILANLEKQLKTTGDEFAEVQRKSGAVTFKNAEDKVEHFKGKVKDMTKEALEDAEKLSKGFDKVGDGLEKAGSVINKGSAAAAAVLAGSVASYKDLDDGYDIIIKKTGATDDKFESLKKTADELFSGSTFDMTDIGNALGEVNTRFGYTEDKLKSVTEQYLQFAKINDADVSDSISKTARIMQAWDISADNLPDLLGMITAKGQETGVAVGGLMDKVLDNNAIFKEMGLSLEESISLMAQFEKNGINDSTALAAMKASVKNAAKEGKPLSDVLRENVNDIKNASNETEALQKATELFGTKGAAEMANAIKEGRIDFDNLSSSMSSYKDTVKKTYDATLDPLEESKQVINNLKLAGADLAATALKEGQPLIEDVIDGVKGVTNWLKKLTPEEKKTLTEAIKIVAVAGPAVTIGGKLTKGIGSIVGLLPKMVSAFTSLTASTTTATVAQEGLNTAQSANPIGAVLTAVGLLVAAMITLATVTSQARDNHYELNDSQKKTVEKVDDLKRSYDNYTESKKNALSDVSSEFKYYEDLWRELHKIVDENGKVKEGYENRAKFITDVLQQATGEEIKWNGNVIQSYKDLEESIKDVLKAKEAEATLSALKSDYDTAKSGLNNKKSDYAEDWNAYLETYRDIYGQNGLLSQYQARLGELNDAKAAVKRADKGSPTERSAQQRLWEAQRAFDDINEKLNDSEEGAFTVLRKTEQAYKLDLDTISEYKRVIEQYEGLSEAVIGGNIDDIREALDETQKDFITAKNGTESTLQAQVESYKEKYLQMKNAVKNGAEDISDEEVSQMKELWDKSKKELEEYQKRNPPKSMPQLLNEIEKRDAKENSDARIAAIIENYKSLKAQYENGVPGITADIVYSAKQAMQKATAELESVPSEVEQVGDETATAVANSKRKAEKSMDGINLHGRVEYTIKQGTQTIEDETPNLKKASEEASKSIEKSFEDVDLEEQGGNIILGLLKGFWNNSIFAKIGKAVGNVSQSIYNAFTSWWDMHSPAKKSGPLGQNIVLGIPPGMLSEKKAVEQAGEEINEALYSSLQADSRRIAEIRRSFNQNLADLGIYNAGNINLQNAFSSLSALKNSRLSDVVTRTINNSTTTTNKPVINVNVSDVTINNDSDIDALTDRIANQLGEKMIQDGRRWG